LRFGNNCRPGNQRETGQITSEQRARALQAYTSLLLTNAL